MDLVREGLHFHPTPLLHLEIVDRVGNYCCIIRLKRKIILVDHSIKKDKARYGRRMNLCNTSNSTTPSRLWFLCTMIMMIMASVPTGTLVLSLAILPPGDGRSKSRCQQPQQRSQQQRSSASCNRRRALFRNIAVTVASAAPVARGRDARAYERRDVGGEGRSATTAAYNIQAYETNNRLEAQGMKLETQQEQQQSLTAALKEYTYTYGPSSPSSSNNKNKNNIHSKISSASSSSTSNKIK